MKRKIVAGFLSGCAALGAIALFAPVPVAEARPCVLCPQVVIECPACYEYHGQTCERCAYCEKIKGCHP